MKRLLNDRPLLAAGAGLVLFIVTLISLVADATELAIACVAALQLVSLAAVVLLWRSQSATPTTAQRQSTAELERAITNVGLRAVTESRATEQSLAARIEQLREDLAGRTV